MSGPVLRVEIEDRIATVTMNRPDKRNAMSDALLDALDRFFSCPPEEVKVAILTGSGGHFCAGLDLGEHITRTAEENLMHSRNWHSVMDRIEFGNVPVISAMFGAVMGGGLELALRCDIIVAAEHAKFGLPEARRGLLADAGGGKEAEDYLTRGIPMRRLAEPEEITRSMLWICDPRNSFMTGQAVALDGGTSAM